MPKIDDSLRRLFSLDGWLFVSMLLLSAFGGAAVYSVDLSRSAGFVNFKKHLVVLGIGLVIYFVFALTDYAFFRATAAWWYILALAALVLVLFLGTTVRGTTGWFRLIGFSFQPAELAKFGTVLMLGFYLSRRSRTFDNTSAFIGSLLVPAIPAFLVFVQPDFGSAVILGLCWFGTMVFLGTKKRYWAAFFMVLFAAVAVMWFFVFKDYQKNRVLTFINPKRDELGAGYNVAQSIIAVGSGKLFGRGLGFGSQSQLRFLPEAQNDFVFAVIGEELGFVGAFSVVTLFGVIFFRLLVLVRRAPDDFSSIAVCAALMILFFQFLINIGAVLGLLPVTGVPLPLISSGGSSFITTTALLGVAQSIYRSKRSPT